MRAASMLPRPSTVHYTGTRLPKGWPVGVDDLQDVRRLNPGPGVRGLMSIASHYGLADIDVVGLRPVASLLD